MTDTVRTIRYPIDGRAQRIIAAAFTEFSHRGIRGARMSEIAREAGVSPATLRQYFPTTDGLFREVIRSTLVELIVHQPGAPPPEQTTTDWVRRFLRHFWESMEEPDQAALLRLSLSELPEYPDLAVFHSTEVIGRAVTRLEAVLREGVRRGEVKPIDVRTAARVVLAALITYAIWFASPGVYGELTGPDRHQAKEAVIDFLVRTASGEAA
jgi:AcrR family transcriptional regulator